MRACSGTTRWRRRWPGCSSCTASPGWSHEAAPFHVVGRGDLGAAFWRDLRPHRPRLRARLAGSGDARGCPRHRGCRPPCTRGAGRGLAPPRSVRIVDDRGHRRARTGRHRVGSAPGADRADMPLAHWSPWDIATALALAVSAWLYFRARPSLARPHIAAFAAGWLALAVALLSPLDRHVDESFSLHMIQHELLMIAAPPLLILGRPYAALATTLPPAALRVAALPLRVPPLMAWGLHGAAIWIWHVPALFDGALAA